MIKLEFEDFLAYDYLPDFNRYHGSSFTGWNEYFEAIGTNSEEAEEDRKEEYRRYCIWVDIQNSPLMKALG